MADKKNGIGQLFHINDEGILKGTQGPGADLTAQTDIYIEGVKNALPQNKYNDKHTFLDANGGGEDLLNNNG